MQKSRHNKACEPFKKILSIYILGNAYKVSLVYVQLVLWVYVPSSLKPKIGFSVFFFISQVF